MDGVCRMPREDLNSIMIEYMNEKEEYEAFASKMKMLLHELLSASGIQFHSIVARTKEAESLYAKLSRKPQQYQSLQDVQDLAGIRIVTYFHDDVHVVAQILEREFAIDQAQSIDKSTLLDANEFGYLSVHYIAALNETRLGLGEYARFQNMQAEVQVRSILQHAWAEIEHDLGYKNPNAVPPEIKRSFSRVAGLLEIADLEFVNIRRQLRVFEEKTVQRITESPGEVDITRDNLNYFLTHSPLVLELDTAIFQAEWLLETDSSTIIELTRMFHYADIRTFADLTDIMTRYFERAVHSASILPPPLLPREGTGVIYAVLAKLLTEGTAQQVEFFFRRFYPDIQHHEAIVARLNEYEAPDGS